MFSFDERFFMFDVTPVENQFILDFLPRAKGDYVKVYLYGLMYSYHPEQPLNPEKMSQDLEMPQEEIEKAFRYWERQGAVRRVADHPPAWTYRNLKQKNLTDEGIQDPEYEAFAGALYDVFDNGRRLHGKEIQTCYEWVEELKLPPEAVIMLLKHMAKTKGKNFSVASADRIAARMADEHVSTPEDAEAFLSRDEKTWDHVRAILRRLGKRGYPSEDQISLYIKWRDEWHFTPDAIEAACAQTAKGEPSMGYLDGILSNIRNAFPEALLITEQMIQDSESASVRLKAVLNILGTGKVNGDHLSLLAEMEQIASPEMIRLGARECAQNGRNLEDLKNLLLSWKQKGLTDLPAAEAYVQAFHDQNDLLKKLRQIWNGSEPRLNEASRKMVHRWTAELGFSQEMILHTAEYAQEAGKPMPYLDKMLQTFAEKGIRTPEEADRAHRQYLEESRNRNIRNASGSVSAQQYHQRDYSGVEEEMMDLFMKMNGGKTDA